MNIIHLIFSFKVGGAETMLVNIMNQQVLKHPVNLIIINDLIDQNLLSRIDSRVRVICINRPEGSRNIFHLLKLNYILYQLKPSILHCHVENVVKVLMPNFRKIAVLTVHHEIFKDDSNLKYYSKIFSISETVKNSIKRWANIDSIVVYNGVDKKHIKQKQNYSLDGKFKILILGRLVHNIKGQHILLEALTKMDTSNLVVDIIGEGASEAYLKDLCTKYQLIHCVNFLGLKGPEYLNDHLRDYDLLIQPSLFEGFGLTIVEALFAKVPVLVSAIQGPLEVINNGEFGYTFESENSTDLASKLQEVINQYDGMEMHQFSNRAYCNALNLFTIEKCSDDYIENYIK